jgi:hypothetical protein
MRKFMVLVLILSLGLPSLGWAAPLLTPFELSRDVRSNNNTLIPNASQWVNAQVLAAGVAETVTVPTGAKVVVFSGNNDFYVNFSGGTAAVPGADVSDGTAAELNPSVRYVYTQGTFSVISPYACIITLSYYK